MVESILRAHGLKTGLFTSPHLIEARERIRINSKPLSRDKFAEHLFECFGMLFDPTKPALTESPAYFRFMTLMAFKVGRLQASRLQ